MTLGSRCVASQARMIKITCCFVRCVDFAKLIDLLTGHLFLAKGWVKKIADETRRRIHYTSLNAFWLAVVQWIKTHRLGLQRSNALKCFYGFPPDGSS